MSTRQSARQQWAMPILLTLVTLAGLLAALLGEGLPWKAAAWIALALPLLVALRAIARPPAQGQARSHRRR